MQALILQERSDPSELSQGGSGGGGDKDMDHVMMLWALDIMLKAWWNQIDEAISSSEAYCLWNSANEMLTMQRGD